MSVADTLRRADNPSASRLSLRVLPPRSPKLVGRRDAMAALCAEVSPEPRGLRVVLYGQGGVGKSAVALEFAYQQAANSTYELVAWLDCDQPKFKEGQLARSPAAARNFNDIASDLAHIVKAEASLRSSDAKESLRALRVRLAEIRGLIVIDGFEGAFSAEGEQFLLELPHTIDLIVTSRRRFSWPKSMEMRPWEPMSNEAREFLAYRLCQQSISLTSAQSQTALEIGHGVPLGISWIATLLARGVAEKQIADLVSDGWSSLLDHFFEDQWAAAFRQHGRRRAAAYLAMVGCAPAREIELIAAGSSRPSLASTSIALIDANLASREGECIVSTPFAREFILRKVGKDDKRIDEAVNFWLTSLLEKMKYALQHKSWKLLFDFMDGCRTELSTAIDWATARQSLPSAFLDLTERVAYYLYSNGDWDSFLRWEERGIEAALRLGRNQYVIEIGLVWGVRIRLHRGGHLVASEFFDKISVALGAALESEAFKRMHLVARSVLRRPEDKDISLARSLDENASALLILKQKEWACRAMLHAGNVWSELDSFDEAGRSFEWIASQFRSAGELPEEPWESEMLSMSIASLGILANRRGQYSEAVKLLADALPGLVQTYDLASGCGEYALALHLTGDETAARTAFRLCQEHKRRLSITKTVMESRPDWDLADGPAVLLMENKSRPFLGRLLRWQIRAN